MKDSRAARTRGQKRSKVFLYTGLSALAVAFLCKRAGAPAYVFWILCGIAIVMKSLFLILIIRAKRRSGAGFYLILAGVGLILISLLLERIYPVSVLNRLLFYGAISFKITGVVLLCVRKNKTIEEHRDEL
jgi:predicted membrane channel-forming protein YqfA (hemolysin III family)